MQGAGPGDLLQQTDHSAQTRAGHTDGAHPQPGLRPHAGGAADRGVRGGGGGALCPAPRGGGGRGGGPAVQGGCGQRDYHALN